MGDVANTILLFYDNLNSVRSNNLLRDVIGYLRDVHLCLISKFILGLEHNLSIKLNIF